ncbi:MAG: hypothetical protein IKI30_08865 [Oxalobacter sp.]|nr:hypothetical protein [Oxalobacter sp.]
MKKTMIASAVALCIAVPAVPVHAGLFDSFFGWVQNTFASFKQKRNKQKQQTRGTAVSNSELRDISNQIMPANYGSYNRSNECWGKGRSCMAVNFANRIRFRDGTLYYLLTSDENAMVYDMYALKKENGRYRVVSKERYTGMGVSGDGMFVQLGRNVYGWNIMTGDKGGSTLYEDFYAVMDGKIRHVASIQDFLRSKPSNNASVLTGDIQVSKGSGQLYPLEVKVTGLTNAQIACNSCEPKGGVRMTPKFYRFDFNTQTGRYQMPVDYPMKGQRF